MRPVRSLLYIPANNEDWVQSAPAKYDADGFIFDLEDSVPPSDKERARKVFAAGYEQWDTDKLITARVNAPETGFFENDLDAIVHPRLDAIVIPKLPSVEDVTRAAHVLSYLETVRGIDDPVEIIALPETPAGFYHVHDLCSASDRVTGVVGGTSRGADVERALGFEWTREGTEKLHMLSKVVLDGKAAGITQLFGGAWLDVEDTNGLRAEAEMLRGLGYTGYQVIHPGHIEPVNEVFTPDESDVEHARRLMEELDRAELEESRGAVRFEGEMIDIAHIRRAEQVLDRARAFDML